MRSKSGNSARRESGRRFRASGPTIGCTATASDWATCSRSSAESQRGAIRFSSLPNREFEELGIPREWVRPILPSPRFLKEQTIECDLRGWPLLDRRLGLIDCSLHEDEVREEWPKFWDYLRSGKRRGVADGFLASRRSPWYSQEKRAVPPFLCTYMGRSLHRPFRFIWNKSQAIAANVYLLMYPKDHVAGAIAKDGQAVSAALAAIRPDRLLGEGRRLWRRFAQGRAGGTPACSGR